MSLFPACIRAFWDCSIRHSSTRMSSTQLSSVPASRRVMPQPWPGWHRPLGGDP